MSEANSQAYRMLKVTFLLVMHNAANHSSERSVLPVTKIKNNGSKTKPSYSALVYDHKINAPHNDEHPAGEVWVRFRKSENKSVKLPVLNIFETAEI